MLREVVREEKKKRRKEDRRGWERAEWGGLGREGENKNQGRTQDRGQMTEK